MTPSPNFRHQPIHQHQQLGEQFPMRALLYDSKFSAENRRGWLLLRHRSCFRLTQTLLRLKTKCKRKKKGEPWTKMHKMQQQSNAAKVLLCNSRWKRQTQCCVQRNVPSECPKSFLQQRGCNSRCLRQQTQQQQQFHCQMQAQLRWGRHRHPQRLQQQCLRFLSFLCRWQMHITSQIMPVLHLPGFTGYYQRCESALR